MSCSEDNIQRIFGYKLGCGHAVGICCSGRRQNYGTYVPGPISDGTYVLYTPKCLHPALYETLTVQKRTWISGCMALVIYAPRVVFS